MQLLPSGLVVPPWPYVAVLAVLTVVLVSLLYSIRPPVTRRQVVAFAPWIVTGGIFHAFYQFGAFPRVLAPLFSAPAVYVTTFVATATVWLVSAFLATVNDRPERIARDLGAIGAGVVIALTGIAYWQALDLVDGVLPLLWPPIGFVGALVITLPAYYLLTLWKTAAVGKAGAAGVLVVYAHALDGLSTAIGIDVVGTGERTPLPRLIMDFAAELPTAPYVGRGWLFVVVKLLIAMGVVVLLADYVEEEPSEGNLLLAFVAAVGLGPAANNLFLFALGA